MSKQRTRYSPQFTFQLALEAAKGLKTIHELASEHGVPPHPVRAWTRQWLEGGRAMFTRAGTDQPRELQAREVER